MNSPQSFHGPEPIYGPSRKVDVEPELRTEPLGERAIAVPHTLSPRDVVALQRFVGNRALSRLLARPTTDRAVQRAVSHSASWPPVMGSPEEALITNLDAQVPNAEQTAVNGVQSALGLKTPMEASYIQRPSHTTWGYVVEEKLNALAVGLGWRTQKSLGGARPDYYRKSNGIKLFVDLTSQRQAGIGGNHITDKLDTAGFGSPNNTMAASDITHQSRNPLGGGPGVIVPGNASMGQVRALQIYRRFSKRYIGKSTDVDFNPALAKVFKRYGDIKHHAFTTKWKGKHRKRFKTEVLDALNKVQPVNFKQHRTRSATRRGLA